MNKKNPVMSPPPTVMPVRTSVKLQGFVAEDVGGSGVQVSSITRTAYEQLQTAMMYERMLYKVQFKGIQRLWISPAGV